MKWKFAFGLASDDLFFVTTRRDRPDAAGMPARSKVTTFADEGEFLGYLMRAGLGEDQTTRLALAVLLSVAKPIIPPAWTLVDVTERQMEMLRLSGVGIAQADVEVTEGKDFYLQAARSGSLPQFYDLLMQAPTAIAMVVGREHRFTFLNKRYAALVGMNSVSDALGRTMLELFPELEAQNVIRRFDRVYERGIATVESETAYTYRHEIRSRDTERYFDSVCQPITNAFGEVSGLLLQATDVTEMVLARDVREERERQLYRQWAELDAIYCSAPAAMMLIDATDFRILRLNEKQAEMLGRSMAELLGRPLLEVAREPAELRRMLEQVLRGEPVKEHIVEFAGSLSPAGPRYWLKSCAPTLSAAGKVESIILVGLEISQEVRAEIETVALGELEVMV